MNQRRFRWLWFWVNLKPKCLYRKFRRLFLLPLLLRIKNAWLARRKMCILDAYLLPRGAMNITPYLNGNEAKNVFRLCGSIKPGGEVLGWVDYYVKNAKGQLIAVGEWDDLRPVTRRKHGLVRWEYAR